MDLSRYPWVVERVLVTLLGLVRRRVDYVVRRHLVLLVLQQSLKSCSADVETGVLDQVQWGLKSAITRDGSILLTSVSDCHSTSPDEGSRSHVPVSLEAVVH